MQTEYLVFLPEFYVSKYSNKYEEADKHKRFFVVFQINLNLKLI